MKKDKKHVLVLGGSSDIGIFAIKKLLKSNWQVTAHFSKNKKSLEQIKYKHFNKIFADFSKFKLNDLDSTIKKKFPEKFDAIINLVGYIDNKSYMNTSIKKIITSLSINALIPLLIERNSINYMLKKKWGRVVNCSSIGVKFGGGINSFNYSLSKHCVEFIPSVYKFWAKNNVLINNLRIGFTDTKIHKRIKKNLSLKQRINLIPMQRMAHPEEISHYIINLISNENTYMTGQTLTVSGGE